jgi:AAA domain
LAIGRLRWSARLCTSGARLQLGIAPAGAGKTTAMRALTFAWTEANLRRLRFYLDHGSVHVGDLAKITDDAFAAWVQDRSAPDWTRSCSPQPASRR